MIIFSTMTCMQDILLDFTSIAQWLKDNWYWVLAGFGALSTYI